MTTEGVRILKDLKALHGMLSLWIVRDTSSTRQVVGCMFLVHTCRFYSVSFFYVDAS